MTVSQEFLGLTIVMVWIGWMLWTGIKIFEFQWQTGRQQAISRPQVRRLVRYLLIFTVVLTLLSAVAMFLLFLMDANFNAEWQTAVKTIIFLATLPFAFLFFLYLQLLSINNRFYRYPFVDDKVVPVPAYKPPPNAGISFDQLSQELAQSLKKFKKQ